MILTIAIYKENDYYLAQCKEVDFLVQSKTLPKMFTALGDGLASLAEGEFIVDAITFTSIEPCPPDVWKKITQTPTPVEDVSEEKWLSRWSDASMPYQNWKPFEPYDKVEIINAFGDRRTGRAIDFWWGYEEEIGEIGESVIVKARLVE